MHLEFGFDSRSAATLIPLGAAVAQTTVNRRVPGSNPGGGVERFGNVRIFQSRDSYIRLAKT